MKPFRDLGRLPARAQVVHPPKRDPPGDPIIRLFVLFSTDLAEVVTFYLLADAEYLTSL